MLLLTGASGRIGRRVAQLVAARHAPLRLMTRTPERAPQLAGTTIVRGDFAQPDTLAAAFAGIETAVVISGSAPPGERALHHRDAFHAAAQAGVQHVVYVSLQGSSPSSRFPYSRDHATSEDFLAVSGVPAFTILRSAFYLDMLPDFLGADGVLHDPAGCGRAALVSREDVARTVAAVLLDPPGGVHDITGPEAVSMADATARLARLTGRSLRYEHLTRTLGGSTEAGGWRTDMYTGWFAAIAAGELAQVSTAVKRFTKREPMTLEAYFSAFPHALGDLYREN